MASLDMQVSDARVMRAMAHPARIAILEHLGAGAQATATECAEVVGLSPSATSYHLRALAKVGLIEDAPSRGDGRERVWRSRAQGYRVDAGAQSETPEGRAATRALADAVLIRDDEQARRWIARSDDEPKEWFEAAVIQRRRLVVTATELNALVERMSELMQPYSRTERPDPPAGARTVSVALRAIPVD
jgi:DNA-binding transcriptional ArsR family regulator